MSHISMHKCLLKGIDKDLLNKALTYLAQQGGEVVAAVEDYSGKEYAKWNGKPIIGAIKTPAVPRGVGVILDNNGAPQFVGDSYNNEQAFKGLILSIQNTYIKMAYAIALNQMGYNNVNISQKNNITVIEAERH